MNACGREGQKQDGVEGGESAAPGSAEPGRTAGSFGVFTPSRAAQSWALAPHLRQSLGVGCPLKGLFLGGWPRQTPKELEAVYPQHISTPT